MLRDTPELDDLHPFGCRVVGHDPSTKNKLENHSIEGIFLGFQPRTKGILLLDNTEKLRTVRDGKFHDLDFPFRRFPRVQNESTNDFPTDTGEIDDRSGEQESDPKPEDIESKLSEIEQFTDELSNFKKRRTDDQVNAIAELDEPTTYQQAIRCHKANEWKTAMRKEFKGLIEAGTFKIVNKPRDRKLISSKWAFKIKRDENNKPTRFKARLVARGFTQTEGVDYFETSSPVVAATTLQIVTAIAAAEKMTLWQIDVKQAL